MEKAWRAMDCTTKFSRNFTTTPNRLLRIMEFLSSYHFLLKMATCTQKPSLVDALFRPKDREILIDKQSLCYKTKISVLNIVKNKAKTFHSNEINLFPL